MMVVGWWGRGWGEPYTRNFHFTVSAKPVVPSFRNLKSFQLCSCVLYIFPCKLTTFTSRTLATYSTFISLELEVSLYWIPLLQYRPRFLNTKLSYRAGKSSHPQNVNTQSCKWWNFSNSSHGSSLNSTTEYTDFVFKTSWTTDQALL